MNRKSTLRGLWVLVPLGSAFVLAACHDSSSGDGASSTDKKDVAEVRLPGIDTSPLTPRERREFSEMVTEFLAPCADTPVTIADCITEKRPCAACKTAAKYVLTGVRSGRPREDIEHGYKARYD